MFWRHPWASDGPSAAAVPLVREAALLSLFKTQKSFYSTNVGGVHQTGMCEVAFLLLGFLGENVALESVFSLDFS